MKLSVHRRMEPSHAVSPNRLGHKHAFEEELQVGTAELYDVLRNSPPLSWLDFWLNPRRLRGSDFLMRWSQGLWSEQRLTEAVNATGRFFTIAYGPSGTAPAGDVRAFELYFERLEAAGLGKVKRPDLLIFPTSQRQAVEQVIAQIGGHGELPFTPESDRHMGEILRLAYPLAESTEEAKLLPAFVEDKNGHILPYVTFSGGRLALANEAMAVLSEVSHGGRSKR